MPILEEGENKFIYAFAWRDYTNNGTDYPARVSALFNVAVGIKDGKFECVKFVQLGDNGEELDRFAFPYASNVPYEMDKDGHVSNQYHVACYNSIFPGKIEPVEARLSEDAEDALSSFYNGVLAALAENMRKGTCAPCLFSDFKDASLNNIRQFALRSVKELEKPFAGSGYLFSRNL